MRKILIIFGFFLFLALGMAPKTSASVYGYILTIIGINHGVEVASGSAISLADVRSGGFKYRLKVIDPADPQRVFYVDDWGISFSESEPGDGKFSISTSPNNNILIAALTHNASPFSGNRLLDLSAQARIGTEFSNRASYSLTVKSLIISATPEPTVSPLLTPIPTPILTPIAQETPEISPPQAILRSFEKNAPQTAAVAIVPIALAGASTMPLAVNLLGNLFAYPILIPSWSRRKKWGVVYDSKTKKPVRGARIKIFSEPDGKMRSSAVTPSGGTFSLIVAPGKYSVTVTANGYIFPSKVVTGSTDGQYSAVYHGGVFETHSQSGGESELNISIPLDQTTLPVWDDKTVLAIRFIQRIFAIIRIPLLLIGSAFALLALYRLPSVLSYVVSGFYCILWIIELRNMFRPHGYGVVLDDRKTALPLVLIRAVNDKGKIVATMVSTQGGKFSAHLSQGQYKFDAVKSGYSHLRTEPVGIKNAIDFGRVRLGLNKLSRT